MLLHAQLLLHPANIGLVFALLAAGGGSGHSGSVVALSSKPQVLPHNRRGGEQLGCPARDAETRPSLMMVV